MSSPLATKMRARSFLPPPSVGPSEAGRLHDAAEFALRVVVTLDRGEEAASPRNGYFRIQSSARVRSEVGLQARQRGEVTIWRRSLVLYRRTPTITTLQTLPSEVGVMVGVVCNGQCSRYLYFLASNIFLCACSPTHNNTDTTNVKVAVFS
jgi:hypothetical protein